MSVKSYFHQRRLILPDWVAITFVVVSLIWMFVDSL